MDTEPINTVIQYSPKSRRYYHFYKRRSDNCYTKLRLATTEEIKKDMDQYYGNV